MSLKARDGSNPSFGTMSESELTPQQILNNLRQGPLGDDPTMIGFAAGQMSEGIPNSIQESIQHEKSIILDLVQMLKKMLKR